VSFVDYNPLRYTDPSGHEPGDYCDRGYCNDERDLTSWMAVVCVDAAESKEMQQLAKSNALAKNSNMMPVSSVSGIDIKVATYVQFKDLVGNGKKYDVKLEIKDQLGEKIKLGNNWYEYSTAGNILYGFYGLAAGFSKAELHQGAGFAQLNDLFAKGTLPGGPNTMFDTEDDYYAVEFGFFLYENYYKDGVLTESEFLDALAKYKHADKLALTSKPVDYRPTQNNHPVGQFYQPQ
jgi:hypothetical protein